MALPLSTAVATTSTSSRGHDVYETPPVAVRALLAVEHLPKFIWEPACGPGAIVDALRAAGHAVLGSDLADFGNRRHIYRRNFFAVIEAPKGTQAIVTNPPYTLAAEFVEHALALCPRVYMLLRLAFLEGSRRSNVLDNAGLRRVYVFRNRLPMMHRAGWNGKRISASAIAFAWFCWDTEHRGPCELHRISWSDEC